MVSADHGARAPSSRKLRVRGLVAAVVLGIAGIGLYQLGSGGYTKTFTLTVVADTLGEGLTPGAEVKFRGLTIGSVGSLETTGYNKQKMTLELEPDQATALAADTTAKFVSSNTFGLAAVELVSTGAGPRLRPGQSLLINSDVPPTSITGLLREGQRLGQIVDSADVEHIVAVVSRHSDLTEPVTRSFFDLAKMLADSQKVPFSQSLSVFATVINGASDAVPLINLAYELLNGMSFLAQPEGVQRVKVILDQSAKLLYNTDAVFARNISWLVPLADALRNILLPRMYMLGSLAPAYDRLSGLIDRTSAAFPMIDGKVRLQIEVIMDTMPGLPAALDPAGAPAQQGAGG